MSDLAAHGKAPELRERERCRSQAVDGLKGIPFVQPRGGFYITVPIRTDEERAAASLLEEDGILVHPGYFYDIAPDHLVMTFIDDPAALRGHFEKTGGGIPPTRVLKELRLDASASEASVGDKVLVEYQTFDKLRYTVDVWSRSSKTIIKSVKTNRLMLTRSDDGHVYFLNNLENKAQNKYEILRTRLQI